MISADSDPTARALRLLELLQARRFWPGTELVERLGSTERTLRRDIERLRGLGYRISAVRGRYGGYRLATGGELPPLVFTGDEAVAISAALLNAAQAGTVGDFDLALVALAKIETVLPAAPAARVRAVRSAVASSAPPVEPVDPGVVAALALACRDRERIRMDYTSAGEERDQVRRVEPSRLVPHGRRWYLLAWDLERADWRTFRVDRIRRPEPTGLRFPPRPEPGGDAAKYVAERLREFDSVHRVTILIHAPRAEVEAYGGDYMSDLSDARTSDGAEATAWRIADSRLENLAAALVWLVWPFEVTDSPQLRALLHDRAARFAAAGNGSREAET